MKVPFTDLNAQYKELKANIDKALKSVIKKSDFILGEELRLFEKEFAAFCRAKFAIGVSSGTDALFLALKSLDIGSNDEVIVPAFTYIATALAVSYTGAKPVFVDIDEATYNIDPGNIEKAVSRKTKAIIPVHLYGQAANMPAILKTAKKFNLKVVEDAAQAHGASIKMDSGKWLACGGIGDIGCFSFYPTKNLGCMGDGGMIVTNDKGFYNRLMKLRDYGRISRYEHVLIGYNSRLDTIQAAVLREKLKVLKEWNELRRNAASLYNKYLEGIPGITIPQAVNDRRHIFHVYAIRTKERDALYSELRDKGIGAIVHYPIPLHLQKAYSDLGYVIGNFPVSEKVSKEIISLPMFPHLSGKEIRYTSEVIKKFIRQ